MNNFGRLFRVNIFGESHGAGIGVLLDGCPAGVSIGETDFKADLDRRKPGAEGTTLRLEEDRLELVSGVYDGRTTGAPITLLFRNADVRSGDYHAFRDHPRPGHADFTAGRKFGGHNDPRGSGHFSGRLTLGLVAAGVIAKKIIRPASVQARLIEVGGEADIEKAVQVAVEAGDSIGGLILGEIEGLPIGLGEPFFDSMESLLAHLVFSIPAVKGIEFGAGFAAAHMCGSEHNDPFVASEGTTSTNQAGGVNGGITNGNPVVFRVAVKPTSSIAVPQSTYHFKSGKKEELVVRGRHDACLALRMPVVIEAAAALVAADLMLLEQRIPRVLPADDPRSL